MITGFGNQALYAACRIQTTHYYEPGDKNNLGSGTGFLVGMENGRHALVTNRHVVDRPWEDSKYDGTTLAEFTIDAWYGPGPEKMVLTLDPSKVCYHPDQSVDIAAIDMSATIKADFPNIEHVEINAAGDTAALELHYNIHHSMLATEEQFATQIDTGEIAFFPGYPEWYDRKGGRPILRTGAILSDPRHDYRRHEGEPSHADGNHQILFEAFSTSGNSGSPVFVGQRGINVGPGLSYSDGFRPPLLIGINAGHYKGKFKGNDGQSYTYHAGLSRMYKATAITALLQEL
ncbi:serine protease [Nocardia alni]|uniref:serine protease n=1 Tax=Nocardia alni TaxID=2815723 RepID=UPI001C216144|nr:serine protease [Nocardia alni]